MLPEIRLKAAHCGEVSLTVCTCSATVLRTFAGGGQVLYGVMSAWNALSGVVVEADTLAAFQRILNRNRDTQYDDQRNSDFVLFERRGSENKCAENRC